MISRDGRMRVLVREVPKIKASLLVSIIVCLLYIFYETIKFMK